MQQNTNLKLFKRFYLISYNRENEKLISTTNRYPQLEIQLSYPAIQNDKYLNKVKPFSFIDIGELYKQNQRSGPLFLLYEQLLSVLVSRKEISIKCLSQFLDRVSTLKIPKRGKSLKISVPPQLKIPKFEWEFSRSLIPLGDFSIDLIFNRLNPKQIICIFASILLERRVIFLSCSLKVISLAIQTLVGLLMPFEWQYLIIPVLPKSIFVTVSAPIPYIIGIHTSFLSQIKQLNLEEVTFVDLDNCNVEIDPIDLLLLPSRQVSNLHESLVKYLQEWRSTAIFPQEKIVESFQNFFVPIFGDIDDFFEESQNKKSKYFFNFKSFRSSKPKQIQKFLRAFSETQMFEVFIEQRIFELSNGNNKNENNDQIKTNFKNFNQKKSHSKENSKISVDMLKCLNNKNDYLLMKKNKKKKKKKRKTLKFSRKKSKKRGNPLMNNELQLLFSSKSQSRNTIITPKDLHLKKAPLQNNNQNCKKNNNPNCKKNKNHSEPTNKKSKSVSLKKKERKKKMQYKRGSVDVNEKKNENFNVLLNKNGNENKNGGENGNGNGNEDEGGKQCETVKNKVDGSNHDQQKILNLFGELISKKDIRRSSDRIFLPTHFFETQNNLMNKKSMIRSQTREWLLTQMNKNNIETKKKILIECSNEDVNENQMTDVSSNDSEKKSKKCEKKMPLNDYRLLRKSSNTNKSNNLEKKTQQSERGMVRVKESVKMVRVVGGKDLGYGCMVEREITIQNEKPTLNERKSQKFQKNLCALNKKLSNKLSLVDLPDVRLQNMHLWDDLPNNIQNTKQNMNEKIQKKDEIIPKQKKN
ncbi:receptor mediated endocytosis [Anaeramoeba flamelloides]|uniref:Receptor mediated endocytosis n=1 Tax=Anaeramoeba flamelloides TaxID=1746091 RepID=A0AAV7Z148_9EUKA|nr:receptor mediated endocytosis [Anaeramoeba flamelloides]